MSEKNVNLLDLEPFDVNVKVAAKLVGLSVGTLNDMRQKGDGPPFFYQRGAVRYNVAELRDWSKGRPRFRSTTEASVFAQMQGAEG
jgi:hypothetical protein